MAFDDLADQVARVPWCWPALATIVLGFYQVGRPVLWRDELVSRSFASRPVLGLVATARNTGAAPAGVLPAADRYPVGTGGSDLNDAAAANVVARQARPGNGIVYQARRGGEAE